MSRLRDAFAHELAHYAVFSPRERVQVLMDQILFFARHARQRLAEVKGMGFREFYRWRRLLGGQLEREWETPEL